MEHVKAGLARLKRAEDEKVLKSKLADLERQRLSLMNLWLTSKVNLEYAMKAQEADMKRLKELEEKINNNLKEIERLQSEIPKLQVAMAEIHKRIEARKDEIKRLEQEERERFRQHQENENAILDVQAKLKEVQQG